MLSRKDNILFVPLGIVLVCLTVQINGQYYEHKYVAQEKTTWCTVNQEEYYKCLNFTVALERDIAIFDIHFINITCHLAFNRDECIQLIDREKAHLMSLDAGEVFSAGRFNSLIPIMQEAYEGGFTEYFAVAVVKSGTLTDVQSIRDLRGKKACFSEVGSQAGWTIPIYTLQLDGGMEIVDCNNHVKSATNFFGPSCAVHALENKNNPIGDNSDQMCALCTGKVPLGKCTSADPYAGFEGAFRCLLEAGDIAFLKHTTVHEMIRSKQFRSVEASRFELLCKDGSRRPVEEYRTCNWGSVPTHAIVTSSARTAEERRKYQKFLEKAVEMYSPRGKSGLWNSSTNSYQARPNDPISVGRNDYYGRSSQYDLRFNDGTLNRTKYDEFGRPISSTPGYGRLDSGFSTEPPYVYDNLTQPYEKFDLFESHRYGKNLNLMFQDAARRFVSIKDEDQSYSGYLKGALEQILGVRHCPINRMTMCVTSDAEMEKCVKMRTALKAQIIKPEMLCYKAHSHINCMQAINTGTADVAVLDASDVYTAGFQYNLVPFMSEVYNLGEPEYYVVAVGKEEDPSTELTYLKDKYTCHTGINTAAGWVYPMAFLIANGWIRPYGCDSIRAAAEYFTKSCVPGAISTEYNTGVPYDNMCDLCHGASFRYCRRDASEDYYGHTGAFRCLVEGGGHVAFVKHTTVSENTGGKRREWWARDMLIDDFELLCPDGTRRPVNEFKQCNLGKVKGNAIVTRGGEAYNETYINAYINLFVYAQQFYGRKIPDPFSMFHSPPPYYDLIFQDATRQLRAIPPEQRQYDIYLGKDFMRAKRITDCESGTISLGKHINKSLFVVMLLTPLLYIIAMQS